MRQTYRRKTIHFKSVAENEAGLRVIHPDGQPITMQDKGGSSNTGSVSAANGNNMQKRAEDQ